MRSVGMGTEKKLTNEQKLKKENKALKAENEKLKEALSALKAEQEPKE